MGEEETMQTAREELREHTFFARLEYERVRKKEKFRRVKLLTESQERTGPVGVIYTGRALLLLADIMEKFLREA